MFLWSFLLHLVSAHYFDIDEINFLKYNIEIKAKPILRAQVPEASLLLKSKYAQEYSCSLPEVQFKQDPELERIFAVSPKLLKDKHCVFRTKGWWTYKVCFGDKIVQYHEESRAKFREVPKEHTVIGQYESEFNWFEKLATTDIRYYEQLPRTYKQYYGGGDLCEENGGHPRKAIVTFVCDMDASSDFIAKIDERELCVYKIVVHTSRMCLHSFFFPGHESVRHKIACRPIVAELPTLPAVSAKGGSTSTGSPVFTPLTPPSPAQPDWVGANPTTPYHDLRSYLDDLLDEEKQAPIRRLKKLFRDAVMSLREEISSVKDMDKRETLMNNPALARINLDAISNEEIDALFQSDELEEVISKLAKETHYEALREIQNRRTNNHIEIKVLYKDENGNMKLSDPADTGTDMQYTVLQLLDAGSEERTERLRQQRLQNGYHYHQEPGNQNGNTGSQGSGAEGSDKKHDEL